MVSSSQEVGRVLGNLSKEQTVIKSNISPNEQNASAFIVNQEQLLFYGSLTVTANLYSSDSLVWNHPVYGDLNTQEWNGDYESSTLLYTTNF
jgi:hypothetical protein